MTNAGDVFEGFSWYPPCQAACPIHQEVREYLRLIAIGDFDRSLEVIKVKPAFFGLCNNLRAPLRR